MKKNYFLKFSIITFIALFSSCSGSNNESLKDAQMCLNKASASTAMSCLDKISSNTSEQAYALRCSAYYISEGLGDPSSLISALSTATDGSSTCSGCSTTMNVLTALSFSNADTASSAFDACLASGLSSYASIASMSQIATLAGGVTDINSLQTAINNLSSTALGEVISETYEAACSETSSSSSTDTSALAQYCSEISVASLGLTDEQIGECTKYILTNSSSLPGYCQQP